MKKILIFLAVIAAGAVFFACSKGDAGPAGPAGENTATAVFRSGVSPSAAYAGCYDTFILDTNPDTNRDDSNFLLVGRASSITYRTLIKFDVDYIVPSNVTVLSAYLDMSVQASGGTITVTAYALSNDFVETEATWNSYSTGNLWTNAGADFVSAASQPAVFDTSSSPRRITLTPSVVQSWIANPAQNTGLLLKGTVETGTGASWIRFDSWEITGNEPKLTINYILP